MVIESAQRCATGLGLALMCALAYLLSFEIMGLLPTWLEYAPGVSLLFLPAGVKLVALLVGGAWGLLGLAAAGLWTAGDVWREAHLWALLGNVLVWLGVPYLVIRGLLWRFRIMSDLSNLSYGRVLLMCVAATVATSLAATAYAAWVHGTPWTEAGGRSAAMALGDFMGASLMMALLIGVLNLWQAHRALDH